MKLHIDNFRKSFTADCNLQERHSNLHSVEYHSNEWNLSGWIRHAIFDWAHLDLRVGFVFLQRFWRRVYLN